MLSSVFNPKSGSFILKFRVLLVLTALSVSVAAAASSPAATDSIVEKYLEASRQQEHAVKNTSMEVDIAGSLPKLQKNGKLHALRRISALGRITYDALRFEGDNTVKREVIARYLSAEADAQQNQAMARPVTPENYKFKYKGKNEFEGRLVHVFEVSPKKKAAGTYKGELWIDADTYLRVRESGYLVKSPSIFIKRIAFLRLYDIRDGISVPRHVESVTRTRLVGTAELTIDFTNFSFEQAADSDSENQ
jgi:hypothetical protein